MTVVRRLINGYWHIFRPSGNWVPDYSEPDTAEKVKRSVDEAYDAHWMLDRHKR